MKVEIIGSLRRARVHDT